MSAGLLAGRLALVTGGGSGIGRAVCSVLAREGALLAVADMNQNSAEATIGELPQYAGEKFKGLNHGAFAADVSCAKQVNGLMADIKSAFSTVPSACVHSAGVAKDQFLLKLDEGTWDDNININLKGTFLVNQALARSMIEEGVGDASIVNISSIVGKTGNLGQAAYAASKSGVIGFTKSAAKELAKKNIRVNTVLPGFIETPMTSELPERVTQMILFMIPMMRMGKPEEIAEVCAFLASPRSSYMTGAVVEATGGLFT